MNQKTAKMKLVKECKHSIRYDAADHASLLVVSSIYIMKTALSHPWPKNVKIVIESDES